jgi:Tol biopolymer transport system component
MGNYNIIFVTFILLYDHVKPILPLFFILLLFASCKKDPVIVAPPTSFTLFRARGLDVGWDGSGSDRIAYSSKGDDGYYDIHLVLPDGSNDICLTCDHPSFPNRHIACPFWHPSGKWIMLVAEKLNHPGSSTDALPGFGAYCDIWIMSVDGAKAYKVVDIANDYDHGVIATQFSPDGKHIVWTDRKARPDVLITSQTLGYWTIKMADFEFTSPDSIPAVTNIRTLEPGGNAFYECYGFSPDGNKLIFCSSMSMPSAWDEHIYTMDTSANNILKLTETDYNEHAFYKPDGSKIVWMTNTQSTKGGTDWWMMDADGSDKTRLTYFNEPGNPQYAGNAVWAGLGSFSPEGTRFIGGRQLSLITQEGEIVMVVLL